MINWEDYFDQIWCINYLPYKNRRIEILKQFQRLNILNHKNFKFKDTFDSPWYSLLWQAIKNAKVGKLLNPTQLKCALAHYSCIKTSLLNDKKRILIIEDDSRFLKNIQEIKNILNEMPKNGDVILFDYFIHCDIDTFYKYKNDKINKYYSKFQSGLASTGCYSLSRKAIQHFVSLYQQYLVPSDGYTSNGFLDNELIYCFSLKQLSCQVTYQNSMSFFNGGNNTIHNMYKKINIDYNEYNMNNGLKYQYR